MGGFLPWYTFAAVILMVIHGGKYNLILLKVSADVQNSS